MSHRIPEHLTALCKNLTTDTYHQKIDEIKDMHNRNSILHPKYDDATSRFVDVITAYNTELHKQPRDRRRHIMLLALTLPHDLLYETIKEISESSLDMLEERIQMHKLINYELEEIKFLLHDISRSASTNDDISFSLLNVYQQAFIASRDILNRMNKLSEAVS